MEYCNIFIAEYQYNQYNNNIIVPSAGPVHVTSRPIYTGRSYLRLGIYDSPVIYTRDNIYILSLFIPRHMTPLYSENDSGHLIGD